MSVVQSVGRGDSAHKLVLRTTERRIKLKLGLKFEKCEFNFNFKFQAQRKRWWRHNNQLHATVMTTTMHNKCACKNHTLEFAKYGIAAVCGNVVQYPGMFKKRCPYRRAMGKECDPLGKTKARYANKKAVNEDMVWCKPMWGKNS